MNLNYQLYFESEIGKRQVYFWTVEDENDYRHIDAIITSYKYFLYEGYSTSAFRHALGDHRKDILSVGDAEYNEFVICYLQRFSYVSNRELIMVVPFLSLALYSEYHSSHFYPIMFNEDFYIFGDSCKLLGITVPPIPAQSKIEERFIFYDNLCKNIDGFRIDNGLTKAQVCALLYDYAPRLAKSIKPQLSILPDPENVWVVGGAKDGPGDYEVLEEEDIINWQCNKDAKRGDIVIVYAHSKYKHIHSIWRAETDAHLNPFGIYANRIDLSNKVIIPNKITFADLKNDSVTSKLKIVSANMEALYQKRPLSVMDYKEIQRLILEKNPTFDLNLLPQFSTPEMELEIEVKKESEVSNSILIPCLNQLGYSDDNWVKELQLKLGRDRNEDDEKDEKGYKARPDFSFFVKELPFEQKYAPLIIEVKYDMTNLNEEYKAIAQGTSYARLLHSKIFGVCDRKKIIIYKSSGDYFKEMDRVLELTWAQISDRDNPQYFNELKKLIGKDVIQKIR